MSIAAYLRVSTKKQAEHGVSLDAQRAEIFRWVEANHTDAEIVEYVDDGYSGTTLERPALQQLLTDLDSLDIVVVWRLDRWSRDLVDRRVLDEQLGDVQLAAVTQKFDDSPEGDLAAGLDALLAEYESKKIGLRTKVALRRKAELGHIVTSPPYGYGDEWQVIDEQVSVIGEIDRLYLEDGLGTWAIAQRLNTDGVTAPAGGMWAPSSVIAVLDRALYAGIVEYGRWRWEKHRRSHRQDPVVADVTEPWFTPIRSNAKWQRIQDERNRRATRRGARQSSPFSAVLRCGICGGAMHVESYNGGRYHSYVCATWGKNRSCSRNAISERRLIEAIWSEIDGLDGDVEIHRLGIDGDRAERELANIQRRRRRLLAGFEAGKIPLDDVGERLDLLSARREALESKLKTTAQTYTVPLERILELDELAGDREALRRWVADVLELVTWTRDTQTLELRWQTPEFP